MEKARKIAIPIVAIICILAIVYLLFFFDKGAMPTDELTTNALNEYTISFDTSSLKYKKGTDFMDGVVAKGADGQDLTSFVTVSCKPTKNLYSKTLTYSINKAGYKISTYERELILDNSYAGPSIKIDGAGIELPLDQAKNLSNAVSNSGTVTTDDGFGAPCSISAVIENQENLEIGDYVATVTAQNIFGDTASAKITVTLTQPKSSIIKLSASSITLKKGDKFQPMDYLLSATDKEHGDVSAIVTASQIDTSKAGIYTVEFRIKGVEDLKNEVAYLYVTVN